MIPAQARIVCAVSGGADSIALLHGLVALNEIRRAGWRLHVAHLDHGLRAESAADAAFVAAAAESLGLLHTIESVDAADAATGTGRSIEEAARDVRYEFLERVAVEVGADVIAVGHQADDQAETVLHHIARGTGLRGLSGMAVGRPVSRGSAIALLRPLLTFERGEIRAYLAARGLTFREDVTNGDTSLTRNRIRGEVLPMLASSLNPRIVTALTRLAMQARRATEVIERDARAALDSALALDEAAAGAMDSASELDTTTATTATAVPGNASGRIELDVERLVGLPRAVQVEAVRLGLERLGAGFKAIGYERLEAAADLIDGPGAARVIEMAGGVTIERRGRRLVLRALERADSGSARIASTRGAATKAGAVRRGSPARVS